MNTKATQLQQLTRAYAKTLDAADPLAPLRSEFAFPRTSAGNPSVYLCGNSLGLMPKKVPAAINQELDDWARFGVDGHFEAATPWFSYHEVFRESGARIVGAKPGEVVMMNSLTVNLHLMMATFYRPTPSRYKILIEDHAFPSDQYAVASQVQWHGYDPKDAVVVVRAADGETLTVEDFERIFAEHRDSIALVMLSGVNFVTGQLFDMRSVAKMAHRAGCTVGFDLAHAAGNVPVQLHDWNADFAVWCSYKYMNAGPGSIAGCFVHEKHGEDRTLQRLAGWWGNNPDMRFGMSEEFAPRPGADGWQLSNPSILAMAPLRASLELFDRIGMARLREKSVQLTGYLETLLDSLHSVGVRTITPRSALARGCQLSIRVPRTAADVVKKLSDEGVVVDSRPPDIVRVAPVPLYNSFGDAWHFANALAAVLGTSLGAEGAPS